MNTKRLLKITTQILGLVALFFVVAGLWLTGSVSEAQGPDFEATGAKDFNTTISISPTLTILNVGETSTTDIAVTNAGVPTITNVSVKISYPEEFVNIISVNILTGTIESGPTIENGTVRFKLKDLGILTGTTSIAQINWLGENFSDGNQPVTFDYVEMVDSDGTSSNLPEPERRKNGFINVPRNDVIVSIEAPSNSSCTIEVGQSFVTRVIANRLEEVDRAVFELHFNEDVVQIKDVRPGGFFGSNPLTDTTIINDIGFVEVDVERRDGPASGTNVVLAEIEWEGLKAGRSFQDFVGDVLLYANGQNIETLVIGTDTVDTTVTEVNGCEIIVRQQNIIIYLDPSKIVLNKDDNIVRQEVKIRGVRNVEEVAFKIKFDDNFVQVADPSGEPATKVQVGPLFGTRFLEDVNRVNNEQGLIEFRVNANDRIREDGTVAVIYWKGIEESSPRPIDFTFVEILDSPNSKVPMPDQNILDGEYEVLPGPNKLAVASISPESVEISLNESTITHIQLDNITRLTEAYVEVRYDTNIVEALHVDPSTLGGQVTNVDLGRTTGVVKFRVIDITSLASSGPVAFITWKGKTVGTTAIDLQKVTLIQNGFDTVPAALIDGTLIIETETGGTPTPAPGTPTPTPTPGSGGDISGKVEAEGRRPNFSGIQVFGSTQTCSTSNTGSLVTTTNSNGDFSLTNAGYQCLWVTRAGHLAGQHSNPSGNLGTLELPAGDLNNDNRIDIFDLAQMGNLYEKSDTTADFNASGKVDIFDLALLARNYNLVGPVNNWQ